MGNIFHLMENGICFTCFTGNKCYYPCRPEKIKIPKGATELQDVMNVKPTVVIPHPTSYRHLHTRFEPQYGALWCYLAPHPRPCFSFEVLEELRRFQEKIERSADNEGKEEGVRYVVLASATPGVFNFGGDLRLFIRCLKENDPETLHRYAKACIDVLYPHAVGFNLPITTISLVQGDALGGGFEAALASDILVSEKQAQFGFPEVLFNLFPGMGAYNLLQRRIGMRRTERMLLNGKLHRAEDLHAEGIVDILAEDGRGENAVYEHIVRQAGKRNAQQAVLQVRRKLRPLLYEELMEVKEIWVDSAMRLGPREIRLMERLVNAQARVPVWAPTSITPPRTGSA